MLKYTYSEYIGTTSLKIVQKAHRRKKGKNMNIHHDVKLLSTPNEIMDEFGMSRKSGMLYRTYIPTKGNSKTKNRKKLLAMDIYTYLQKNNVSMEALVMLVNVRKATRAEVKEEIL